MRGSLGAQINGGGTADIHAWAPGQVVKLFKSGYYPRRFCEQEAWLTRTAFAAGLPVPEVLGDVTLDERYGIVFRRLDGPTLLQATRSGAMTWAQAGRVLASLGLSVHRMPPPPQTLGLRDGMDAAFARSDGVAPPSIVAGVRALIDRLPPDDGLCHGDLHPGNIIMTADGPKLIDWTFAIRAPAAFDHALTHLNLTEFALDVTDEPRRPLAVNAAALTEYSRLSGKPEAALRQAMESWLPIAIVRYFLLMGGPTTERWRRLMQRVEEALRGRD